MNVYYSILLTLMSFQFTGSEVIIERRESRGPRVNCYFQSSALLRKGRYKYGPKHLVEAAKFCTHVLYGFVGLNDKTWEVLILNPEVDIKQRGIKLVSSLPQMIPGLKTVLSMGGWGEWGLKYSQMVSRPERRTSLIKSVITYMKKFNFDGFDLDWEYPAAKDRGGAPEDRDNLTVFLKELRIAFENEGGKNWEITMAIPVKREILEEGYDLLSLCRMLDGLNYMAYDLRGPWNGFADVHSPIERRPFDDKQLAFHNVRNGLEYLMSKECPAEKIVLGVPFYGKRFRLLSNESNCLRSPTETKLMGGMSYYEICEQIEVHESNWTSKFDSVGKCPYAFKGKDWIGYENLQSLKYKIDLAISKKVGGMMMWAMDLDDYPGSCGNGRNPMLDAIHSAIIGLRK